MDFHMIVLRKSFYIRWSAGRSPRVHEVNPGQDLSPILGIPILVRFYHHQPLIHHKYITIREQTKKNQSCMLVFWLGLILPNTPSLVNFSENK